ncbi:MAG TPA: hypothetical protein VJ672_04630 [Gemmatimonadaceae bacterium]|nr:hypothetical protein [Gemmatimonadaceae bacterium]
MPIKNPFRATDDAFHLLGRDVERQRAAKALRDPAAKLLILAPRKTGKTTLIRAAAADARSAGSHVITANLAGISCLTDVASRILRAAAAETSRAWPDATGELVRRLAIKVTLEADSRTGAILPSIDPALRRAVLEEQHALLRRVLDTLNELAHAHDARLGIALDEVQELFRLGGSSADWALASAARQHASLCYLLSSSAEAASHPSPTADRSPLSLFEALYLGPLPHHQVAGWIDDQLRLAGIKPQGTGESISRLGGRKLANVAQIAAYCFDGVRTSGFARAEDVDVAFATAVGDCADITRSVWESLTAHQQNVLRALSVKSHGLTTSATRERFSLGDTGTTHNSAQLLVRKGILERTDGGYLFESPFVRGWVIAHALADVGITLPITHVPPTREH